MSLRSNATHTAARASNLRARAAFVLLLLSLLMGALPLRAENVPYQLDVSPGDPTVFRVFNPAGPGGVSNPVELLTFAGFPASSPFELEGTHTVLSTPEPGLGVVEIYFDAPPTSSIGNPFYLRIVTDIETADGSLGVYQSDIAHTSPTRIDSWVTADLTPPNPSHIRHEFAALLGNGGTQLAFNYQTLALYGDQWLVAWPMQHPAGSSLDLSQPLVRVELRVSGVPEPGSLLLAAVAGIGGLAIAAGHPRKPVAGNAR